MIKLSPEDIAARIPHRYQNLLLDKSVILSDSASEFELSIGTPDVLGRDIFNYEFNNQPSLPAPVLAEISALACIVSSGAIKPGTFAYFASINNFKLIDGPFNTSYPIKGSTQKISGKNGFFKYSFSMNNEFSEASGQLMAFYDSSGTENVSPIPPIELAEDIRKNLTNHSTPIEPFSKKNPMMTFVDHFHYSSPNAYLYSYTYPKAHPLINGHFPGNPVMMGVCQWQMLEDSFTDVANRASLSMGQWSVGTAFQK